MFYTIFYADSVRLSFALLDHSGEVVGMRSVKHHYKKRPSEFLANAWTYFLRDHKISYTQISKIYSCFAPGQRTLLSVGQSFLQGFQMGLLNTPWIDVPWREILCHVCRKRGKGQHGAIVIALEKDIFQCIFLENLETKFCNLTEMQLKKFFAQKEINQIFWSSYSGVSVQNLVETLPATYVLTQDTDFLEYLRYNMSDF